MKTILISGCSYCSVFDHHELQQQIKKIFAVDNVVNISLAGASIQRQIKAVIEWITLNEKPFLILLPLTHITRYEESLSKKYSVFDNYNTSLCVSMDPFEDEKQLNDRMATNLNVDQINNLLKLKTLAYNSFSSFDDLLSKIITFSGWLENKKINHLIFDMCNFFDKQKYQFLNKNKLIENNTNIIDLFDFCGNDFMYNSLTKEQLEKENVLLQQKNHFHYGVEPNKKLINHLKKYIIRYQT